MFLCIIICHLTFVHCYLLQCYILYTVLNSLARILVCASTQNLCRFIHKVSYTTCMVISTFITSSVPCLTSYSKGIFSSPTKLSNTVIVVTTYPLKFLSFTKAFYIFIYICVYVYMCTCIHIAHCLSERQV